MKIASNSKGFGFLRDYLKVAVAVVALAPHFCQAITILSGPTFTPAGTNAPLAGTLAVSTDVDSLVSVSVSDGFETWDRDFFDYGTNHSEILLGFKPGRTNQITISVRDAFRNTFIYGESLSFVTAPLPANMPNLILVTNDPAQMEPGYTMFRADNATAPAAYYVTIVDESGQVVWYSGALLTPSDIRQLANGNLFFPNYNALGFTEANMLGKTVQTWAAPAGYPVDSHEDLLTDHGTILYLNYAKEEVPNFPSSVVSNAPTVTTNVTYGRVVEISATNSSLLYSWSLINMLDPVRIDYLCYLDVAFYGVDPEHANAIIDDTNDDSIIVSLRNQDAIIKFSRSGQLKWILGNPANWGAEWQPYLLTPVGTPFAWNFAQHAPTLTPQGTLLFFDDGNDRAEPYATPVPDADNYSRAAEFSVDETNMEVSQVWEFTGTNYDRLYVSFLGNAPMLPQTGNVLVNFGAVGYENGAPVSSHSTNSATMVRIKEVTHEANPSVVFDLEIFDPSNTNANYAGCEVYRSYRIPDLYAHPAVPVPDLTIQIQGGLPLLQFTADPMLNYVVQASSDLINWSEIGLPLADDDTGDFSFIDNASDGLSTRYYRLVTQ
jgi:arylsulfate sulfotransferase